MKFRVYNNSENSINSTTARRRGEIEDPSSSLAVFLFFAVGRGREDGYGGRASLYFFFVAAGLADATIEAGKFEK